MTHESMYYKTFSILQIKENSIIYFHFLCVIHQRLLEKLTCREVYVKNFTAWDGTASVSLKIAPEKFDQKIDVIFWLVAKSYLP